MNGKITVYGDSISGNCYKIKLLCSELAIDYEWRELDILAGATGEKFTLADIALFAYTHVADEGGFDPGGRRGIADWLERIMSRPNYTPMYS